MTLFIRRWKLFGNETQEKDFVVTGGLLWWKEFLVIGCYNLTSNRSVPGAVHPQVDGIFSTGHLPKIGTLLMPVKSIGLFKKNS